MLKAAVLVATLVVVSATPAVADGDDHDRARAALDRGEVMPLRAILDKVERDYPGQIVEVELERQHGRWIYEIRVLRTGGVLLRLEIDARDGTVIGSRTRERSREDGRR